MRKTALATATGIICWYRYLTDSQLARLLAVGYGVEAANGRAKP